MRLKFPLKSGGRYSAYSFNILCRGVYFRGSIAGWQGSATRNPSAVISPYHHVRAIDRGSGRAARCI
jgi:hypothetical protein